MNVEEAMEKWKALREEYGWLKYSPTLTDIFVAEIERLKAELAAAKAASVCPVKFDGVYANSADEAVVWFEETGKAEQFADWLREMKERGNQ